MSTSMGNQLMFIESEIGMIKETFFIPCENETLLTNSECIRPTQWCGSGLQSDGCWISDIVAADGSRAVYSGARGICPLETGSKCIGRLMPQMIDSRHQPKSLTYRLIEARRERDASICRH